MSKDKDQQPKADSRDKSPGELFGGFLVAAAIMAVGIFLMAFSPRMFAQDLQPNANARLYLPVLVDEYLTYWPEFKWPEKLAGQVDQETCPSQKSPKCWNPRTENINPKNNGEYGFGLSQLTNTNKYDNFKEVTTKYQGLKSWKWDDRFNPEYQLRTLIYMDRACARPYTKATEENQAKFAWSCYNGGQGSVLNDRKYCAQTPGCNPEVWDDNVETHSLKPRSKLGGYRLSAYDINREYVDSIWNRRWLRYEKVVAELVKAKTPRL